MEQPDGPTASGLCSARLFIRNLAGTNEWLLQYCRSRAVCVEVSLPPLLLLLLPKSPSVLLLVSPPAMLFVGFFIWISQCCCCCYYYCEIIAGCCCCYMYEASHASAVGAEAGVNGPLTGLMQHLLKGPLDLSS